MSVRSFAPGKEILTPRGMWSVLAQKRKGSPERASFMQNARISPGVAGPRPGTSRIAPASGKVTGLFNWVAPSGANYVLYRDGSAIVSLLQPDTVTQLLAAIGATYRPTFADFDIWVYFTGYDVNGDGSIQCYIYDGANTDKAFRGPIALTSVTPSDGGAGFCTEGTHYIAFVYQNRTGFAGVPTSKTAVTLGITESQYPNITPPDFGGSSSLDVTLRPTVLLNGWGNNAHVGGYEMGVDQGFGWGFNNDTTYSYINADAISDGNSATYAEALYTGTHKYAGCIWSFPAAGAAIDVKLNITSEVLSVGSIARSSGIWYSVDGGSNWTEVYNDPTRAQTTDVIPLPNNQDFSRVQVMAFSDAHDDQDHRVYEISITYTTGADIHGTGESPSGVSVAGSQNFTGWVNCDSSNVVGCLLYIDDHYIGQSTYGQYRPDKAAEFPASPDNPNIGFTFAFDISVLAPGLHYWYEVVYFADGRSYQLPTASFEVAPNPRKVNIAVEAPALSDGGGEARLYLIMTRADNPNQWYFMPTDPLTGAIGDQPVPLNTPATLNFIANLSDEDMASQLAGDTADEQFDLLTQDGDGNGPFNPTFVVAYGDRMCYGVGTSLYISNKQDPQHLTGDQHVVVPPNKRKIGYAFPLPGSLDLFLTGDRWTSRVTDTGDVPATWAPPIKVSDSLGAPFPSCVCFRTRGNYAWLATEAGVYHFTGSYADKPLTYLVSDQWKRVNWAAAYAIEMADDVVGLKLYVAVPLDGAVEPTHLFVFDYTNGLEFDQVDIGIDKFNRPTFSSIGVVKEIAEAITNLWIGPSGDTETFFFEVTVTDALGAKAAVTCSINLAPVVVPPPTVRSQRLLMETAFATNTSTIGGYIAWARYGFLGPGVDSSWADTAPYDKRTYDSGAGGHLISGSSDYTQIGIPDTPENAALAANWTDLESAKALFKQMTLYIWMSSSTRGLWVPADPDSHIDVFAVFLDLELSDGSTLRLWPTTVNIFDNGSVGGGVANELNATDRDENSSARITRTNYQSGDYSIRTPADNFGYQLELTNFVP